MIPTGPLSEKAKLRLKMMMDKREERLKKFVEDARNTIIEKSPDGFLKVTIPNLGIVTWAKDEDDVKVAVSEAIVLDSINRIKSY